MTRLVRSRLDIALGRQLRIGHELRRRTDGTVWKIRQLRRVDCVALLHRGGEQRLTVPFAQLRAEWDLVTPLQETEAA